jgi:hypothetical protein
MPHEALDIFDVAFMVTSQIDRAPQWTMVRELTMNAIEAASKAQGEKVVHWTSALWKGTRKAVIWNTGPGMDAAELKSATRLACEINKNLGLDENFGVGAKVSSLRNNRLGMQFRSCKAGKVSEVILGYDPHTERYVRFERDLGGKRDTVIDVTTAAIKAGRDVSYEWTEVMLLGNSDAQDTTQKLFAIGPPEKAYIANTLYRRFYRLPEGVKLKLDACYHRLDGTRNFFPIGQRYDKFERSETVHIPELNIKVHFLHDPWVGDRSGLRTSSRGALSSTTTTCSLVHKDEMYSVMTAKEWSAEAPRFGIPFGSKELCVHIELADDDARPTQYRERLISKQTGDDILPKDFALEVRERMPEWVQEVIRNASPRQTEDYSDIQKELQTLLAKYKVKISGRHLNPAGEPSIEREGQGQDLWPTGLSNGVIRDNAVHDTRSRARRLVHEAPEGATTTSLYEVYEKPPQIIMLETQEAVDEKKLKGRAAELFVEAGTLFVNGLYEAVDRTIADIEPEFAAQGDPESVRALVTKAARWAMAFRVGKATVFALAKRLNEDWSEGDMRAALTKESLSIAADNYEESLSVVRRRVRDGLKLERAAA